MKFYRITKGPLMGQLKDYLHDAIRAEEAAVNLAREFKAREFMPSGFCEQGSIMALRFYDVPHHVRPLRGGWFEPDVMVRSYVTSKEGCKGWEFENNSRTAVSVKALSIAEARHQLTLSEALRLTKVERKERKSLRDVCKEYGVLLPYLLAYRDHKIFFDQLCNYSKSGLLTPSRRNEFDRDAQEAFSLEKELSGGFEKTSFFMKTIVKGSKKAVEMYRKIQALPAIPTGTLAQMLKLKFENDSCHLPAYFFIEGTWYISTSGVSEHEDLEEIGEEEFAEAKLRAKNNK